MTLARVATTIVTVALKCGVVVSQKIASQSTAAEVGVPISTTGHRTSTRLTSSAACGAVESPTACRTSEGTASTTAEVHRDSEGTMIETLETTVVSTEAMMSAACLQKLLKARRCEESAGEVTCACAVAAAAVRWVAAVVTTTKAASVAVCAADT